MSARSSSFQHRVRVAKRLLNKRGYKLKQNDGKIEVVFPEVGIKKRNNTVIRIQSEQSLINLALQILRAEKNIGVGF